MAFCTKCGNTVEDNNQFCGKCGAARSGKPAPPAVEVTGAVERDAKIRLKREHEKLLTSIGLGSGVATLIGCVLLLVLADALGHALGGVLVGGVALISGVLFVRSFKAEFAEKVNRSSLSPDRIDPLSGEPLRMVWWFRWLTAVVSIFMLVALGDYVSPPPAPAGSASASASSASANDAPPMTTSPSTDPQTQQYVEGLQAQMKTLKTSTDQFSALMAAPRLNDAAWKLDVAEQLAIWRGAYTDAQAMQPPAQWREIHAEYVQALQQLASASDDYAQGLDDMDADQIKQANAEVQSATKTEYEVASKIYALVASR